VGCEVAGGDETVETVQVQILHLLLDFHLLFRWLTIRTVVVESAAALRLLAVLRIRRLVVVVNTGMLLGLIMNIRVEARASFAAGEPPQSRRWSCLLVKIQILELFGERTHHRRPYAAAF